MAAVLPNPRRWRPDRPTRYIAGRAETIDRRVTQLAGSMDCVNEP
jgi:monofunctional biosynthetic peptidoglycan transglycosylase